MDLSPMRYKGYTWPHNPRVYSIDYERKMAVHKTPFGLFRLQDLGRTNRIMEGEGEFVGEDAYEQFGQLANVFYRLKLIEAYGTGILKINESYADCTAKPQFEVTDNAFKITLPNINYTREHQETAPAPSPKVTGKSDRQEILLRLAEKQGHIVRKDVEEALKVSQATAILILRGMVEKGLLIKEGSGKQQKYHIAE